MALLAPVLVLGAALFFWPANKARTSADTTRRTLRSQGFKLESGDFQRTNSPQVRDRLSILIDAGYDCSGLNEQGMPNLMESAGSNAAVVVWQQAKLPTQLTDDLWPGLETRLEQRRSKLDRACAAILDGPLRCELGYSWTGALENTNLGVLKTLSLGFSSRLMQELHQHHREAAWTNLLAQTRLVTTWQVEPAELSHMVRMGFLHGAFAATWQALQTNFWSDAQLAALQREWESLDVFTELAQTAALAGANAVMACRLDREEESHGATVRQTAVDFLREPGAGWREMVFRYREFAYRTAGSYEDENALMLYFRDREGEIQRASAARSWAEMRLLPGVTNQSPLPPTPKSRRLPYIRLGPYGTTNENLNSTLLGRAASSEALRRLLVTAIAIERYRLSRGTYPASVSDIMSLVPLGTTTDFMDGKPLRYHLTGDGHFLLYSVGLDCVDQGGDMRRVKYWHQDKEMRTWTPGPAADLVWPLPALPSEREE
jgi:hypothetical protein